MKLWRTAYSQWREVRKFLKEAPECISSKPGLAEAVGCLRANIDALMCGDRCFKSVTSLSPSWKAVIKLLKLKHALSKTDKLRVESFTKSLESLANGIRPTNDVAGAGLEVGVMDVDNIGRECRNETSSDSEKIKNEAAGNGFFRGKA
jgi:hypothetical protein